MLVAGRRAQGGNRHLPFLAYYYHGNTVTPDQVYTRFKVHLRISLVEGTPICKICSSFGDVIPTVAAAASVTRITDIRSMRRQCP